MYTDFFKVFILHRITSCPAKGKKSDRATKAVADLLQFLS